MSAEILQEAAALMRALATGADTGYAWEAKPHSSRRDNVTVQYANGTFLAHYCTHGFATHAASWHPAVALAVADWLDNVSEHAERYNDGLTHDALAVARAYLGRDA